MISSGDCWIADIPGSTCQMRTSDPKQALWRAGRGLSAEIGIGLADSMAARATKMRATRGRVYDYK